MGRVEDRINQSTIIKLTGAFLSIGLMINFLSLKEMFLISLQGNPILGVSLDKKNMNIKSFIVHLEEKVIGDGNKVQ